MSSLRITTPDLPDPTPQTGQNQQLIMTPHTDPRRTRPAATVPTCANAQSFPEKRDQAANRKKKGSGGWPVSHDAHPLQGTEHWRTPDQQAEGPARDRLPTRQTPDRSYFTDRPRPQRQIDLDMPWGLHIPGGAPSRIDF